MTDLIIIRPTAQQTDMRGYSRGMCKILWPGGGMVPGKKMKNEAVRNKMKKKEKEEKGKGESDFFVNIMHTSVDHRILT